MSDNRTANPLVSVVTPAYNEEDFLGANLRSIRDQSYSNVEHVVVDDGSTDTTSRILRKYVDQYDLRWVSQENRGFTSALNRAVELAEGEIIVWLNADDVLFHTEAIDTIVSRFVSTDSDFLYGSYARIDASNQIQSVKVPFPWFNEGQLKRLCFGAFNFFRAEVIDEFRFDESYDHVSDYEFYLRAFNHGFQFEYVDEILFAHRRHAQTKTSQQGEEMFEEQRRCQREFGQNFGLRYKILRIMDLAILQLLRLWGGILLVRLKEIDLAFDAPDESLRIILKRQIRSVVPSSILPLLSPSSHKRREQ